MTDTGPVGGNPLDQALLRAAAEVPGAARCGRPLDPALPEGLMRCRLTSERRRLTWVVVERSRTDPAPDHQGVPEGVLACCTHLEAGGIVGSLDDEAHGLDLSPPTRGLGRPGAFRPFVRRVPAGPRTSPPTGRPTRAGLTLAGLLGVRRLLPRPDTSPGGRSGALARDGVRVVHPDRGQRAALPATVCSPGRAVLRRSWCSGRRSILPCSDAALAHTAVGRSGVFARVSPAQKTRVIRGVSRPAG